MRKLKMGGAGASQRSSSISASHLARGIHIERGVLFLKLHYKREAHGNLRGSSSKDKQEHDLPLGLTPLRTSRNEGKTARVEHDLDAHQREDQITPREKSGQTQNEQHRRQQQRV